MVGTRSFLTVFTIVAATVLMLVLPSWASAAPANDNFADAQTISGQTASVDGTNVGATLESGDPTSVGWWPFYVQTSHTVWYRWTAPFSGPARIDTCTSDFDTILGVYTGSALGSLTEVASSDDECGSGHGSEVSFQARENTTYQILVDGWRSDDGVDDGRQGTFTLEVNRTLTTDCRRGQSVCDGTQTDDRITGTRSKDTIKAYGGEDRISALGANDVVLGGADDDVILGNNGPDRLYGGEGDDVIDTGGLDKDRDAVKCGAGYDVVWREGRTDTVDDCEEVHSYNSGGGY
jgi:Ca2+-binding RTX toxin-like protein